MKTRILFIRPAYKNTFSKFGPVTTEPLELEYLAAVAVNAGFACHIHDPLVDPTLIEDKLNAYSPDIVAVSGYYPARPELFATMRMIKQKMPHVPVIAGGVDVEICYKDYYASHADILVYSGGVKTFQYIIENIFGSRIEQIDGICYRDGVSGFVKNKAAVMALGDIPRPDRTHFYQNKQYYYYIGHKETALVKGAYSCPYACNFCYARLLNQGNYLAREMNDILDEIRDLNVQSIWIVDDVFLPDRKRAQLFIDLVEKKAIKKDFIIYSRADFLSENKDLVPKLRASGVVNIICGLEAVDNEELDSYQKGYKYTANETCAKLLAENDITLTALFIVGLNADFKYFVRLLKWIVKNKIKVFTISVFTPLPGTRLFDRHKAELITRDPLKWDFMHLVLKPENTGIHCFYLYLWSLYLFQVFINPVPCAAFLFHKLKTGLKKKRKSHVT